MADTDCIPAMKHGRIPGLQIALVALGKQRPPQELLWHSDFLRRVAWPVVV
jgi:hypothetical protein